MNLRTTALSCALILSACASNRPAENPDSESPTSEAHESAAYSDDTNSSTTTKVAATDSSASTPYHAEPNPTERDRTAANEENEAAPKQRVPKTINASNTDASSTNADPNKNSASNSQSGLTPMDQGNSEAETAITAAIRQDIMRDASLSFTAKNAKVITIGSKVTLEGVVKNEQERARIELLARQAAGVTTVDNCLKLEN